MSVSNNDGVIWKVICVHFRNVCVILNGSNFVFVAPQFAISTNASVKVENLHWCPQPSPLKEMPKVEYLRLMFVPQQIGWFSSWIDLSTSTRILHTVHSNS
jgi:hypothetical protein